MENDETMEELDENKMYYQDEPCRHTDVIYLMKIKFHFQRRRKNVTRDGMKDSLNPFQENLTDALYCL